MSLDDFVAALLAAPDADARRGLLSSQPHLLNLALVQKLKEYADQAERDDAWKALNIGRIAEEIAETLDDNAARAFGIWIQANAHHLLDEYESALQEYEGAAALFRAANRLLDAARTSVGHTGVLIHLGRYDEAQTLAEAARAVFLSEGDKFSQAKLDLNIGNLYEQIGQPARALESFQQAISTFESFGESLYTAMAQVNAGNMLIQLDNFLGAEKLYAEAQPVFESAGLRTAVAILDQYIAGLQYARKQYAESFQTFERARAAFTALGMDFKIAETDLYESDLYLDLSLPQDALRLAQKAEETFARKGASFELARAQANRAMALARLKPDEEALPLLEKAHNLFLAVGNEVWAAHTELQQAEVLGRMGNWDQANILLAKVADQYERLGLKTKQVYANILIVEWLIYSQQWEKALEALKTASEALTVFSAPWLAQRIETAYGQVYNGMGDLAQAALHHQAAVEKIESMAASVSGEEHLRTFVDNFISSLLAAPDADARRQLLLSQPHFLNLALIKKLKERADQVERDDAREALNIGRIAEEVAEILNDDIARAFALWSQAKAYGYIGEFESAVREYIYAAALFRAANQPLEAARASVGYIGVLIHLGRYDEAQTLSEATRTVLVSEGDDSFRAKLDMNIGMLYDRSGKPAQALASFRQAISTFESLGESLHAAMNQVNAGNVLIQLDNFLGAQMLYDRAQPVFEEAGLRNAAAVLDQDISRLQSARGNYAQAFRTLERARTAFTTLGMEINIAETDLYESDLYLELNLPQDALRLAEKAEKTYAQKGVKFEMARARANRAIALARLNPNEEAAQLLSEARDLFRAISNEVWATHAELQRAEVLTKINQWNEAYTSFAEVAEKYERLGLRTKQAYANIVAIESLIFRKQWPTALAALQAIRDSLLASSAPWLLQRLENEYGRVYEGMGDVAQAVEHYQKAVEQIESVATAISAEEHRTAFVADKTAPYEALVSLLAPHDANQALTWTERAKSRALVSLLAGKVRLRLRVTDEVDRQRAETLEARREELNWLYTRLTRVAAPDESGPPVAGPEIWPKIREKEQEIMALSRDLQAKHAESLSLERISPPAPIEIQGGLPEGAVLVEYFIARGQVLAFVVNHERINAHPSLTTLTAIQPLLEELAFQLSKFQFGPAYYQRHSAALYESTVDVLDQLYQQLFAPLWPEIADAESIIIVPHGPLHALPFHALYRDGQPLAATHTISYAPSAAVLQFCWKKVMPPDGLALLLGIPDETIPQVVREVETLAKQLPNSVTLLEEKATYARLRDLAPSCSILHLATHGMFRPDAPLLSGVRLADQWLTAQDVYDLDLIQTSLVTLSACESGLGQVAGGDDIVGLVRGFLYAGASSLLVTLWQVADDSMTDLMSEFYRALLSGKTKAAALRQAQRALMETHPHPYFWASLALVGSEK